MPAEVDLLCEYYISSNLNSKKQKGWSPNNITSSTTNNISNGKLSYNYNNNNSNNNNHHSNNNDKNHTNGSNHSSDNNRFQNLNQYDTIDFVKYEKNPLSILKTKYKTLASNGVNTTATSLIVNKQNENISRDQYETNNSKNDSSENNNKHNLNKSVATTATNNLKNNNQLLELNWSKIRKIGIGLLNLGNNCYLNATLQCLAYTPPFSQWLVARPHTSQCRFKQFKGFCSLCEVERIVFDIFNSGNGFAKPNTLCYNIKKISNVFGIGTQEDASEFFTTLLESMAKSIRYSTNPNGFNNSDMFNNKKNMKSTIPTILDDIFSFQFRSRITCGNCGRLSDTIENTNTWPIDVKFVQDIRKGMLHFLRQEVLEGENSYKCDKCNKKTRATKQYSIRTAPNILVVHLKRFDFSFAGKLSHFVQYPELLSLKTLIPDSQLHNPSTPAAIAAASLDSSSNNKEKALRNVTYKLYGVLVHLGHTSHSGHYYSYVRGPNDQWYKADDTRVSIVQSSVALAQNAYILFYNKITSSQNGEEPQRLQKQVNSLNTMNINNNNNNIKQQIPNSISESNIFKLPQNKFTHNIDTNINSSQPSLNAQDRPKINPFQINGNINIPKKITISNGHLDLNGKSNNNTESSDLSLKRKLQDETNSSNNSTSLPKIYSYNGLSNILNNRPKIISESSSPIKTSNLNGNSCHSQQEKEKLLYGPQLPSKIMNGSNGYDHNSSNGHQNGSKSSSKKESSEESSSDSERKKDIIKSNKLKLKKLLKSIKNLKKINDKSMKASKKMKKKKIKFLENLLKDKKLLKLYRDKTSNVFKRVKKLKKLVKKNKSNRKSSSKEKESDKYSSKYRLNGSSSNSDYKLISSYSNGYHRSIPIATSV